MTQQNEATGRPTPSVTDLFQQYLYRQIDAHAQGLGHAESTQDAVPHEAGPVHPVDPQLAWKDAVAAMRWFTPAEEPRLRVPPDWPVLVSQQEPAVAVPLSLGNFPQMVRNLHVLLHADLAPPREGRSGPMAIPAILDWATQEHQGPQRLLAAGVLRLARHFDHAEALLATAPPPGWEMAHANEVAALAWQRGQANRALALWQAQSDRVPVLFNRGMALLCMGQTAEAIAHLRRVTASLPETSAWHHLACLYLALAQTR